MSSLSDERWEFGGLTLRITVRRLDKGWMLEATGMEGRSLGMAPIVYRVGNDELEKVQLEILSCAVQFSNMIKKTEEKP